jgi:hypothetical protein
MSGCPETLEAQALATLRRMFPRERLATKHYFGILEALRTGRG